MKNVVFLAIVAALGGFLFGYDTAVISGTISTVGIRFGLDSLASGWYVGCALVGSIAGVLAAGSLSDYLGRRLTMMISAVLFTVSAAGCTLAPDFVSLVIFRIIGGVGIGVVSIVSPLYIAEISPPKHRGTMVLLYQLAITVGFLGAYLANFAIAEWGGFGGEVWRPMLGAETLPALMFLVLIFFIPESPRWLELRRSGLKEDKPDWRLLIRPGVARAVAIGAGIAILGQFMGVNAVLYYGPTIFESSGLSQGSSLLNQTLVGLVNFLTTVLAVVIIDKVGRKKLVYWGVSGMVVGLLSIAWYFALGDGVAPIWLLVFFLFYVFCQAISISAVIFVLLSEMYPARVRGMAMSIAGFSLWVGTYLIGQLTPAMLEGLTPAGTFLFFAAMCVPYMLIVWRLVPETTGKSLDEIERYWVGTPTAD